MANTPVVAYFITDHGLGHAARSCAVLEEFAKHKIKLILVSGIPQSFFLDSLPDPTSFELINTVTDVGVFQETSVVIDYQKTILKLKDFWDAMDDRIAHLSYELTKRNVNIIVFDIPALAPLVASELKLPSIAVTNFSWDFIYKPYIEQHPQLAQYVDLHLEAYSKMSLFLALPYNEDIFPSIQKKKVNFLGRRFKTSKENVRNLLNLNSGAENSKLCLYSFGGHEFPVENHIHMWNIKKGWKVVIVTRSIATIRENFKNGFPDGVVMIDNEQLKEKNITYVDLVNAVDVIACKTGYGIVSECVIHRIPVLYTDRDGFEEHKSMVKCLEENGAAARVEVAEVLGAKESLFEKAEKIVEEQKSKTAIVAFDGALQIVKEVLAFYCQMQNNCV